MSKYKSRFENFFLNLRLNRAEFGDMATHTLEALQKAGGRYQELSEALSAALGAYRATHAGQLSGEARSATLTAAQALADFKTYVKKVERKHVIPTYDEGSADLLAIFPKGRAHLSNSSQVTAPDQFAAFLQALDERPAVFPDKVRAEGRAVEKNLTQALARTAGAAATADTLRADLHDGREETCRQLFRAYATLLLEHHEQPSRVAAYFDLSKAKFGGKRKAAKLPTA